MKTVGITMDLRYHSTDQSAALTAFITHLQRLPSPREIRWNVQLVETTHSICD